MKEHKEYEGMRRNTKEDDRMRRNPRNARKTRNIKEYKECMEWNKMHQAGSA